MNSRQTIHMPPVYKNRADIQRGWSFSVEMAAEFQHPGARGFHRRCEWQRCGIIEQQNYAVQSAFAGTSGERQTNGVKQFPATGLETGLHRGDDFAEALGSERYAIEKLRGEKAQHFARGIAR